MTEAIEALKSYKTKCNHEGDIYSAMVVQRCKANGCLCRCHSIPCNPLPRRIGRGWIAGQ